MNRLKKNIIILLLAVLLAVSLVMLLLAMSPMVSLANTAKESTPVPPGPSPLTEQEKVLRETALRFLTDVATLNTSSYHIEVYVYNYALGVLDGKTLRFNFTSAECTLDVTTEFKNGELFRYKLYPVKGSPAFIKPASSDILNTAKDTLDSLQTFSPKEYLPTIRGMLGTITVLQS